jgi:hypothetical protein
VGCKDHRFVTHQVDAYVPLHRNNRVPLSAPSIHSASHLSLHSGGIIGSTTAYYLTRHPKFGPNTVVHVLEATAVAAGSVPSNASPSGSLILSISLEPQAKLAASSQRTGMPVLQPLWPHFPSTSTMSCPKSMVGTRNGGIAASGQWK